MDLVKVSKTLKVREADLKEVLTYIEKFWPKLIRNNPEDAGTLIGLPYPYVVPSASDFFQEMYYWDSYPVILALLNHKKYSNLAIGMVENLLYMIERFGIIPNASRFYFLTRSQPPLLSHAVRHIYEKTGDKKWFANAVSLVEYEYRNVWYSERHPNFRRVYKGLSRYYDVNVLDDLAEAESGWDMTARYSGKCLDYLPVDLNCLLYVYEEDLANSYKVLGNDKKLKFYKKRGKVRAETIRELMWGDQTGFFYDYNFTRETQSHAMTVAGIYPMTVGIASKVQAKRIVETIEGKLLKKFGVVQGQKFVENKQWDWPNGWALMQLRIIEGLMAYGYDELAVKIIQRWISINIKLFKESGKLWEKYDVVHGRIGMADRYPTQHGFAWTNACFLLLLNIAQQLAEGKKLQDKDHLASSAAF